MKFIKSSAGYIKLDAVSRFEASKNSWTAYDNNGDLIGTVDASFHPEYSMNHEYVAAMPGSEVVVISPCGGIAGEPLEVTVNRYPVAAWRIHTARRATAEAVLIETLVDGSMVLHPMPDGRYCDPENCFYDDLEAAKAEVLENAQAGQKK
jgi:hypothetical protein